ncbi:MAG: choice-of-anchor C family protein [Candidatus Velthaea sp.]
MTRRRAAMVPALLALAALGAGPGDNLVVNGSFDTARPLRTWLELSAGSTRIPGWRVAASDVDLVGAYWQSPSGNNSVELDGVPPGALEQRIATVAGRHYRLSFSLAGNPDGPPRVKVLDVRAGSTVRRFTFDVAGRTRTAMGYVSESLDFVAASAATTIRFANAQARYFWGPVIADVTVRENDGMQAPAAPAASSTAAAPASVPATAPATAAPAAAATTAPSATLAGSLAGVWLANYPGSALHVRIEQHGASVVARAVETAGVFTGGMVVWYGRAAATNFVVVTHCGDAGARGWHGAVIRLASLDAFRLETANCAAAGNVDYVRSHL